MMKYLAMDRWTLFIASIPDLNICLIFFCFAAGFLYNEGEIVGCESGKRTLWDRENGAIGVFPLALEDSPITI